VADDGPVTLEQATVATDLCIAKNRESGDDMVMKMKMKKTMVVMMIVIIKMFTVIMFLLCCLGSSCWRL